MTPAEKLQKRKALYEDMKKLNALAAKENRSLKAEEAKQWEDMDADFVRLGDEAHREERLAELDKLQGEQLLSRTTMEMDAVGSNPKTADGSIVTMRDTNLAFTGWCRNTRDLDVTDAMVEACQKVGLKINARELNIPYTRADSYDEVRAMYSPAARIQKRADQGTGANVGGEFIPEGFMPAVEISLLSFGRVRAVAQVIRTETGNDLPWPTVNDTANTGELLAENAATAAQEFATAAITLKAYKYGSKLVTVSTELFEDSAINIPQLLGRLLGERIARITNTHFTSGDNSSKPQGVNAAAATGKTAAGVNTFTSDELIDVMHSVDEAYRDLAMGCAWMMSDTAAKVVRKLKDGGSAYIWQPSLTAGQPDTLFNFPVHINAQMPALTTGLDPVTFGAFQKYIVRDIAGFRLRRLVERYAEKDQDGFVAFSRHDGRILDAGTDPFKNLTLA